MEGALPPDLQGTLLRVGPAASFGPGAAARSRGPAGRVGDEAGAAAAGEVGPDGSAPGAEEPDRGALHAVELRDGKAVSYLCRQTPADAGVFWHAGSVLALPESGLPSRYSRLLEPEEFAGGLPRPRRVARAPRCVRRCPRPVRRGRPRRRGARRGPASRRMGCGRRAAPGATAQPRTGHVAARHRCQRVTRRGDRVPDGTPGRRAGRLGGRALRMAARHRDAPRHRAAGGRGSRRAGFASIPAWSPTSSAPWTWRTVTRVPGAVPVPTGPRSSSSCAVTRRPSPASPSIAMRPWSARPGSA